MLRDVELVLRVAVLVERVVAVEPVERVAVERVAVALVVRVDAVLLPVDALVEREEAVLPVERVVVTLVLRDAASEREAVAVVPCERETELCVRAVASPRPASERAAPWVRVVLCERATAVWVLPKVRLDASVR